MILDAWAKRWNIPPAAVTELKRSFGTVSEPLPAAPASSETAVLVSVKLEASRHGARLWRNNKGATYTADGSFIRYGLANESKAVSDCIKSADLIGIRPVIIKPEMVGYTIGQFVSREIKIPGWKFQNTEREQAQLKWAELIISLGGDACFATGVGTL
jgi:hypothetical protein